MKPDQVWGKIDSRAFVCLSRQSLEIRPVCSRSWSQSGRFGLVAVVYQRGQFISACTKRLSCYIMQNDVLSRDVTKCRFRGVPRSAHCLSCIMPRMWTTATHSRQLRYAKVRRTWFIMTTTSNKDSCRAYIGDGRHVWGSVVCTFWAYLGFFYFFVFFSLFSCWFRAVA